MKDIQAALAVDYGIQCAPQDEKRVVKSINAFLASLEYRKMYKWEDKSIQNPQRTFRIAHYYCQFIKLNPRWYFDLRPNIDLDGKARFPEHPDFAWTIHTRKTHPEACSPQDHIYLNEFFAKLLTSTDFPTKALHVYEALLEERL